MRTSKKTKEEMEKEWAEFEQQQALEFEKLLIEKGIKKERITSTTNINTLRKMLSPRWRKQND